MTRLEQILTALLATTREMHARLEHAQQSHVELLATLHRRLEEIEASTRLSSCSGCGARWRESLQARSLLWCPRCSKEVHQVQG